MQTLVRVGTLVLLAVPGAFIGLYDAATAITIGSRLLGMILALAGVALLYAAFRQAKNTALRSSMASLIGSVVSILATVHLGTLGLRWLSGLPFDVRSGIADLALILLGLLVFAQQGRIDFSGWLPPHARAASDGKTETNLAVLKDVVAVLGVIAIAGTAATFWITNVYTPATAPPGLNLAVSLTGTEVEPTSDRVPVTGLITLENSSHVRVRVLGAVYNIVGLPSSPSQQSYEKTVAETFASNPTTADSIWPTSVARDAYGPGQGLASGRIVADGNWLEPDMTTTFTVTTRVPRTTYSRVRFEVQLIVARGDRVASVGEWRSTQPGACAPGLQLTGMPGSKCTGIVIWSVDQDSLFFQLTRDPIEVGISWWVDESARVATGAHILWGGTPWTPRSAATARVQDAFAKLALDQWGLEAYQSFAELDIGT